jgi:hypothetical protein
METRTFEALQAAIKFEEDGRAFFSAANRKTWIIFKGLRRFTIL